MGWGRKWFVDFNSEKTYLALVDQSNNSGGVDVKMSGPVLEKESYFKMLGQVFPSKLDKGSYTICIAKTTSKKIGTLILSLKFLSPEAAMYLYKSTIWPCMKYCCDAWAAAPSRKRYKGLLVLHLLPLLNPWLIIEM